MKIFKNKGASGSSKVSNKETMSIEEIRKRYGTPNRPGAIKTNGLNHAAFISSNMTKTIWFWCELLGFTLIKTLELPGGGQHFFLDSGNGSCIAYFYFPNAPKQAKGIATVDLEKMLRTGDYSTAHGSLNHIAFTVNAEDLPKYREKLKASGCFVSQIMIHSDIAESGYSKTKDEHTIFESLYFFGPDGEYFEFCSCPRVFTSEQDVKHMPNSGISRL